MKFDTAILIGLGGTGSHLADPLVRLLSFHENGTLDITFVDGDEFTEGNASRQLFPARFEGYNKARAIAANLEHSFVQCVGDYVNGQELLDYVNTKKNHGTILVVLAVDNDATRKSVIEAFYSSDFDFVLVNPGNTETTAMISVFGRLDGRRLGNDPLQTYANLREPDDVIPGHCVELAPSAPQLLIANAAASFGALTCVWNLLEDNSLPDELYADVKKPALVGSKVALSLH